MPHLTIEHSANLAQLSDLSALCDQLRDTMLATSVFPHGGIRVRCLSCQHYTIADGHQDNAFAALVVRMGAGRSNEDKQRAGAAIMAAAEAHFAPLLDHGYFMLSLDIVENDPALSWKTNTVHARLKAETA